MRCATLPSLPGPGPAQRSRLALPVVPVHVEMPPIAFQETAFPLADLQSYSLRERAALDTPQAVKDYLQLHLANKKHECFAVLFLDNQHKLLALEELFRGTLAQTSVYPREVVLRALHHHAAAVVLAHNHPSGTVQPSRADEALTQALKAALALVDVRVLDHMIVAPGLALSMAEKGLV